MSQPQLAKQIFAGHSEMAILMRSHDWSQTLIGPVSAWSGSLKTAVNICLNSRFPMVIWWGEELVLLYNDAWQAILGNRHPKALSSPGEAIFSESWHIVGPQLKSVLETGTATWAEDLLIPVLRSGYLEEAYYTYSYSPIFTETGKVEGVFTAVAETTHRVLSERRLATLKDLAAQSSKAKTVDEVYQSKLKTLSNNSSDIPLAALYRLHSDPTQAAILCGQTPADLGAILMPTTINLSEADPWSFAAVLQSQTGITIEDLAHQWGEVPVGVLSLPINQALVLPIRSSGQDTIVGLLVVGVNPACSLDSDYRTFFDLIAGHIETAIANASAYEAECKRAEALVEIDRAKTAFFSNVSHEFRTPLTLMLGPLEETLSNAAGLSSGDREQLTTVHRNSLRLLKLVNTLLDFSRIEAGRIQAVYQLTDLTRLTADLAGMFRSATDRAGLSLVVDCCSLSEPTYVDPEMWEKIVLNLLSNAFKFTFEGEIAVALRNPPDRIELEIRDTGTGIPANELPHIFEWFHQVQGAKGRTYEGSGIGLSLVQELVALHGGTIQVNSVVDQGTSFTISIPTGSAHLPSDQIGAARTLTSTAMGATPYVEEILRWLPEKSREGAESLDSAPSLDFYQQTKAFSGPKARILLADDNADMRHYLKRLLSQQYEVEAVTDGSAALAAVRQQRPDLVLTDIMMPELDGFGLLQELRADPQTQALPIILLSARAGEESRIEGLEAGADDYLTKPFSARELLARVEANLKLAQMRQQIEAALREGEERLQLAVQAGQMVAWEWNPFDDTITSSPNFSEIYGLAAIGSAAQGFALVHPEDRSRHQMTVENATATGSNYQSEFRFIRPDNGEIIWLDERGQAVLNDDGSLQKLIGVTSDITERKHAEALLRASHDTFHQMVEHSPFGVYVVDADFCLAQVSVGAQKIFENVHPLIGRNFAEVLRVVWPEPFASEAIALFRQTLKTGEPYHAPSTVECRYDIGTVESYDWKLERIALPDGRFGVVCHFYDLSERQRYEAALRESEERLRLATEAADIGMWFWNLIEDQLVWTTFCKRLFGLDPDIEMSYERFLTALHPDDRDRTHAAVQQAIEQKQEYNIEYRGLWDDGSTHWILAKGRAFYNEQGEPIRMMGIAQDVTDRKQAEVDLQVQARELGQINMLLMQTTALVNQRNQELDQFTHIVSHDLKAPLRAISNLSIWIEEDLADQVPPDTKQNLDLLRSRVSRMENMINGLLTYARVGYEEAPDEKFSLQALLLEIIDSLDVPSKFTVQIPSNLPILTTNRLLLSQVFTNLISNGIKHHDRLKGTIQITSLTQDQYYKFSVSDDGPGIELEQHSRIFDIFQTLPSQGHKDSTGVGLAIIKKIIERIGGQIYLESELGQGTSFHFTWPIFQAGSTS